MISATELADWVQDARRRTFALVADLDDAQLQVPYLPIINPFLWELGHLAWFQEKWVLRRKGQYKPVRQDADSLYDSSAVAHQARWKLPLPSRTETLAYLREVRDWVLETAQTSELSQEDRYFILLSVFHEDMHTEAFTYTRQTLGYPAPFGGVGEWQSERVRGAEPREGPGEGRERGRKWEGARAKKWDVEVPGGTFLLGAPPGREFVFDNEKWAHPVEIEPFVMSRTPVIQEEFAAFVDEGGYRRQEFWSVEGWCWRQSVDPGHPVYWRRSGNQWRRRHFDRWVPLEPRHPVVHVNWFEADAYCRWAGRRLPTEAEWESAASGFAQAKPRFPWGDQPPSPEKANLDWRHMGCVDVDAFPEGDSVFGVRQLTGNVWEWTASSFLPYPGFVADPYKEYSAPWFGTHRVLRGGCWATGSRLLRNTWRNFYLPDRRDVWAGFRTCGKE